MITSMTSKKRKRITYSSQLLNLNESAHAAAESTQSVLFTEGALIIKIKITNKILNFKDV